MKKSTAFWLILGALLVIIGLVLFGAVMSAGRWDFNTLNTVEFGTNSFDITEDFSSISMRTPTADIRFVLSDGDACRVVCFDAEDVTYSVGVEDDTLKIENSSYGKVHFGVITNTPSVTVYLPRAEYALLAIDEETGDIEIPADFAFGSADISLSTGDCRFFANVSDVLKVDIATGHVQVENIMVGSLSISGSTGDVEITDVVCVGNIKQSISTGETVLRNVECARLDSDGDTGDLTLVNVIAAEEFVIKRSTGDVRFDRSDAAEITVNTNTGYVKGSLLTEKVFLTESDTGSVSVPKSITGGKCEITTDTGDINIEFAD